MTLVIVWALDGCGRSFPWIRNHGRRRRVMCKKFVELRQTLANWERVSQIRSMMVRVHWLETEMESAKRSRFATGLGNGNEKIGRRWVQLNVRRFPVM